GRVVGLEFSVGVVEACLRVAVPLVQGPVSRVGGPQTWRSMPWMRRLAVNCVTRSARGAAPAEVEEARRLEFEAERELEDIRRGRRLYQYIQEQASGTDYQHSLGGPPPDSPHLHPPAGTHGPAPQA